MHYRIGFIGAGKMAEAMIAGLIAKDVFEKDEIVACAPSEKTRWHIEETYGVKTFPKAADMVASADILIIAVKPKQVPVVFNEDGVSIPKETMVVSIVAGMSINTLKSYVPDSKIIRVMPNHCCMVLEGAMGYACDSRVTPDEKAEVAGILSAVGYATEVPEDMMDAVTGIAGSSPAFMYMIIDAMADAGVLNGLSRADAIKLAAQSMLGAAKMVMETGKHPDVLKDEVCSPAGTTIVGVRALEDAGLRSAMIDAVDSTVHKSKEMGKR